MGKKLSEMTLEELWTLFPIRLTEHNAEWKDQYAEMAIFLENKLSSCKVIRISHIGSTAINGILAKPMKILELLLKSLRVADLSKCQSQKGGFPLTMDIQKADLPKKFTICIFDMWVIMKNCIFVTI